MLELGLNPDEISEEAYLKARRQYTSAKLTSLAQLVKRARA